MPTFTKANDPNAARLIESLRHLGYGNYVAIADLVDNSIDAGASRIAITIQKRGDDVSITIADDGTGMDYEILDQALRLGSLVEKDPTSDLGKFGMGLVTAGLSIARQTHVVTKRNGVTLSSIADVDEVIKVNKFCKHLEQATQEEIALFAENLETAETGTVVTLLKCDNLKNKNTSVFANTLRKHLGRIHRYFIASGIEIKVNGEAVPAIDPLELENPQTVLFSDDTFPYEVLTATGVTKANVRTRIVLIDDNPASGSRVFEKGINHQGFSVLRNQREILFGSTLTAFTKHNDFNRMRGEVFFSGELDSEVGIDFTKRDIVLNQALHDKLLELLKPQCTTIKHREATRHREARQSEVDPLHEMAAKGIAEKSRLLIKPKREDEPKDRKAAATPTAPRPRTSTVSNRKVHEIGIRMPVRFVSERLGPNGQIFECDQEGQVILIRWNIEHPFYQRFVVDNISNERLVTAVDYLIYSMASAELKLRSDDETVELLSNLRSIMSSNMRTLLS